MKEFILVYIAVQLLSNAYGLAVIGSVRPLIEQKLQDKGYVLKNKNSLYKFNEKLGNFFKGFIPFYYAAKAISLVQGKDPINRAVEEEIVSGNFITRQEQLDIFADEEAKRNATKLVPEPQIMFEKPEKYTARKNDITLYDTYETPQEYIERETTKEEELELTPFLYDFAAKPVIIEKEVTNSDIAKAISSLEAYELEALGEKVMALTRIKKGNKRYTLEKDVA